MNRKDKYDFFISHASEDKSGFVKELAAELKKKDFKVWYDQFSISVGDSLIDSIQDGIKNSHYGLIVLSPNFFNKEWTKKELNIILTKEIVFKENIIIPVWHKVTFEEVFNFSPMIADRLALTSEHNSISEIVEKIQNKTQIKITPINRLKEKINYLLSCNDDRRRKEELEITHRIDRIFSYQKEYYNYYMDDRNSGGIENWNEALILLKEKEFKKDYDIPLGVWTVPEPFEVEFIEEAKKLAKKWLYGEMSLEKCDHFYYLLEEELDTDIFYILYGFPHGTMKIKQAYPVALDGIVKIGTRSKRKK